MSYYGISSIKLNEAGTEVEEVKIHKYLKNSPADSIPGLDAGTAMAYHDVANLIVGGDRVFVIVPDESGAFQHTDEVRVKPGQHEYLESFGKDDAASDSLMALPKAQ